MPAPPGLTGGAATRHDRSSRADEAPAEVFRCRAGWVHLLLRAPLLAPSNRQLVWYDFHQVQVRSRCQLSFALAWSMRATLHERSCRRAY